MNHELQDFAPETGRFLQLFSADVVVLLHYIKVLRVVNRGLIIGAVYTVSGGSILPAILMHLTVNLAANWALFAGFQEPNAWFQQSLLPFAGLAGASILMIYFRTGVWGLTWLAGVTSLDGQ